MPVVLHVHVGIGQTAVQDLDYVLFACMGWSVSACNCSCACVMNV